MAPAASRLPARAACPLLALLLTAACASIEIETAYDRTTDFSTFETWDWIREPRAQSGHPRVDDPATHNRIRNAVERELAAMGYDRVFAGRPSFWVAYHLSLTSKLDTESVSRGIGYAVGDGWGPGPERTTNVQEYEKGTLIIDLVDAREEKLAFRGIARKRLDANPSPKQARENFRKAVEGIFEDFPPGDRDD